MQQRIDGVKRCSPFVAIIQDGPMKLGYLSDTGAPAMVVTTRGVSRLSELPWKDVRLQETSHAHYDVLDGGDEPEGD